MGVPNEIMRGLLAFLCISLIACQPIAIRSVTNGECRDDSSQPGEVCVIEFEQTVPEKGIEVNSWLHERMKYCGTRSNYPEGQKLPTPNMRGISVNPIKRQQLSHLAKLSCDIITIQTQTELSQPDGEDVNQNLVKNNARLKELQELLAHVLQDKEWSSEFNALFFLLNNMANEFQHLHKENEEIRQGMQKKIDALMQLEKDISNRDTK